jgi:penicillin V acylase-like amidase (Ntn superfamily)
MADALGVPHNVLFMTNHIYELDAFCTSIVARDNNGKIIVERNLDFYFAEETRKLLYIGKHKYNTLLP